jgi:uncharacterized protein DUF4331
MSHHLDSPASRQDPRLNVTDMYLFDGELGTVFVMAVNTSLAGSSRPSGFHPEARYEFKVHSGHDPYETISYRFTFGGDDGTGEQSVSVYQLTGADARDDSADGALIAQGRTGRTIAAQDGSGLRAWAGGAADPFYLDLHQLTHIIEGLQHEQKIELAEWAPDAAASSFAGSQIEAIVLEVPISASELASGRDIGAWSTTKLATDAGGWRQINRAAIPMVWPLFRAVGGDDESDDYTRDTTSHPADDLANDAARVAAMVAAASRATGTSNPQAYGQLVAKRLLPDVLPYTVGTPAAFSFDGFNGRALADNAPEVMYGLVTNSGFPTGLTSFVATETRAEGFPYVVPSKERI